MATPAYLTGGDGQRSCSTRSPGRNKCPYIPNTSFLKTGHRIFLQMSKWTHYTWPDSMKVSSKLSCSYPITRNWWILYNLMNLNSPRKCHCLQWIKETSYIWHFVRKEIALQDHALKAIFSLVKTVLAKKKKNNENHQVVQKATWQHKPSNWIQHSKIKFKFSVAGKKVVW